MGHEKPRTSKSWDRYADGLLAERYLKRKVDSYTSPWMERGAELEDEAIRWYEFDQGVEVRRVGFITSDDFVEEDPNQIFKWRENWGVSEHKWYRYGASPDFLVGDEGLGEIKVPGPAGQMHHLRLGKLAIEYKQQLQGQLWVAQRQWTDVISYHPEMPRIVIRVERDEEYIALLEKEVTNISDEIDRVYRMICAANGKPSPKAELRERLKASLKASP
jgi:hypothetical protein